MNQSCEQLLENVSGKLLPDQFKGNNCQKNMFKLGLGLAFASGKLIQQGF